MFIIALAYISLARSYIRLTSRKKCYLYFFNFNAFYNEKSLLKHTDIC